jgi:NADH-quinone oxidoreductase subunit N
MNAYLLTQLPLVAGFVLLLIVASIWPRRQDRLSHVITVVALVACAILTALKLTPGQQFFGGAIQVTSMGKSLAYAGLGFALIATILAEDYLSKVRIHGADFRMIVLALALGLFHLPLSGDLATLFIAFELISIPSYVLAGFNQGDARANEAGMKYLVVGMFASSLFLLGIAFLYGATGEIHLSGIRRSVEFMVATGATGDLVLVKVALVFLVGALLFKTGSAPLHLWLPDVYEGSNLASLAFLSVPVKVASFGLLGLLLWGPFGYLYKTWMPLLLAAALCCALFGNLQAILQVRLKRLLAYSAVANAGFILLSLMLNTAWAFIFYLVVYGLTTLGVLAAFMALGTRATDVDNLADLRGMGKKYPWLSAGLTLMLFSLAGIPITAGFSAKFAIISEAFKPGMIAPPQGFLFVLITSVVLGLVSFFFYFKLVRALWFGGSPERETPESATLPRHLGWNSVFVLSLCAVAIVGLGLLMRLPGIPLP